MALKVLPETEFIISFFCQGYCCMTFNSVLGFLFRKGRAAIRAPKLFFVIMHVLASEAVNLTVKQHLEETNPTIKTFSHLSPPMLAISKLSKRAAGINSNCEVLCVAQWRRTCPEEPESDPPPEDFIMAINAEFSEGGSLLMTERANYRAVMFFSEINNEWQGTLSLASARLPNVCFQVLSSHWVSSPNLINTKWLLVGSLPKPAEVERLGS